MSKQQYVLFHVESDKPVYPVDHLLTKEEAEEELARQEHADQLEIRQIDVPQEDA
jgi:hypothetical protein